MYRCESRTIKKAQCWRIDAFKLWCWRRFLKSPLDCKKIKPVNPKGNQPWIFIARIDAEAEAPILWPPNAKSQLIRKRQLCWERLSTSGERGDRIRMDGIALSTDMLLLLLLLLSRFSRVRLCATPKTAAHQAPLSLGFSRQEHWSALPFPSPMHESEKWKWSRSVMSDSLGPHGLQSTRFLCPREYCPGKSTGVGCHWLLHNGHEFAQTWEIVKDREAWSTAIHGVTKSRTQLSNWTIIP